MGTLEWVVLVMLVVSTLANVAQVWLTWFMMRELGDIDKNRSDWWERLEDRWEAARRLRGAVDYMRGKPGNKGT